MPAVTVPVLRACVQGQAPATTLLCASGPFSVPRDSPPSARELTASENPPAQVAICGWVQVGMAQPGSMPQHLPTMLCFFKGDMNQNRPKG